jgi:hypothetical protein
MQQNGQYGLCKAPGLEPFKRRGEGKYIHPPLEGQSKGIDAYSAFGSRCAEMVSFFGYPQYLFFHIIGPETWSGNPISTALTMAISITIDENNCPTPSQPSTPITALSKNSLAFGKIIYTPGIKSHELPHLNALIYSQTSNSHGQTYISPAEFPAVSRKPFLTSLQADTPKHLLLLTLTLSKPDLRSTLIAN